MSAAETAAASSEDHTPVRSLDPDSPTYVDVPFWVTACVRLAPPTGKNGRPLDVADKVFPVVQALLADQHRTVAKTEVELDRDLIARIAGYSTAKRATWVVDYLQRIGFLRVRKNYEPGSGRRSSDTFVASRRAPAGYVGPNSYAGLVDALRSPHLDARALFVDLDGNTRSEPKSALTELGSEAYYRAGGTRVQNTRSEPKSALTELGSEAYYRAGGTRVQNTRSEPKSALTELADGVDREMERPLQGVSPSRSIDQTHEADKAASASDETLAAARKLVQRLPWKAKGHRLSVANADKLARAIATAITAYGLTLEQAQQHALHKLSQATTIGGAASFVIDGFKPGNLDEPLAAETDTLPLPQLANGGQQLAPADAADQKSVTQSLSVPAALPACATCRAYEGDPLGVRTIGGGDAGAGSKCPDCHPAAKAA